MKLKYLIIFFILFSCNAQEKSNSKTKVNTKKNTEMTTEIFNIEKFNKNKIGNEYNFILEDGTKVRQFGGIDNFIEYRIGKDLLGTYKEYYFPSGKLKISSKQYFNEFDIDKKEYDEKGKLIRKINYNKPFKFNFEQLIKLIQKEKDNIDILDKFTKITRENSSQGIIWYVTYKKDWGRREVIKIDGITGEILERSFYPHEDN